MGNSAPAALRARSCCTGAGDQANLEEQQQSLDGISMLHGTEEAEVPFPGAVGKAFDPKASSALEAKYDAKIAAIDAKVKKITRELTAQSGRASCEEEEEVPPSRAAPALTAALVAGARVDVLASASAAAAAAAGRGAGEPRSPHGHGFEEEEEGTHPAWLPPASQLVGETLRYPDGSTYEGQLFQGRREGHGVLQQARGRYEGQWHDDRQHGLGTRTLGDGQAFEGHFDRGRLTGNGQMQWATPRGTATYDGQYADNLRHGLGRFAWPDGRVYDGGWSRGRRHGWGALKTAAGERRAGHWADDRLLRWDPDQGEEENVSVMLR